MIRADTSKGDATYLEFGTEQDVTINRINLYALRAALGHFHSPAKITVYTDSSTVAGAFNCGNIRQWKENGFLTSRGRPLANADLWRRVASLAQNHLVNAILTRRHQYSAWAEDELRKKYGRAE